MMVFVPVFADNSTTIENQNITIKAEIQESQELKELLNQLVKNQQEQGERFNQLIQEFHKKEIIQDRPERSLVSYDSMFIGSATIAGLFSIGLFATSRFQDSTKSISAPLLHASVAISGIIISIHILNMLVLVLGVGFSVQFYIVIMTFTVILIAVISGFIGKIILVENNIKRRINEATDDINKKFAD